MTAFRTKAVKVKRVILPGDNLFEILSQVPRLKEKSILAVTSKIVSLCEGRALKKSRVKSKDQLIKQEAEKYIPRSLIPYGRAMLTLKNNVLTVSAGIDEFGDYFVLWPKNPAASAKKIQRFLRKKYRLKNFGVIITDSHTVPLRRGILGFALGFYGFRPLRSYEGRQSLFGRRMTATRANVADALAAAAVLAMGEGGERTPFAVISGSLDVNFTNDPHRPKNPKEQFELNWQSDIYRPFFTSTVWKSARRR